jgi:MFS family permease
MCGLADNGAEDSELSSLDFSSMNDPSSGRAARTALTVLTLVNLFNYLDRYVVASLVESLKKAPLFLSDTQLGSLMTGFILVYMLTSPIFGTLGDRRGRPRLLALGVGIWSVATALGGLARSFAGLFTARAAVGIGEAAYGTIAPALLADHFPREKRGRVFAVFFAAIPIGSAAGYVLGGLMDQKFGWRAAFYVAGLPGLALALLCLRLKDPQRGGQDAGAAPEPKTHNSQPATSFTEGVWKSYSRLMRNRPYRLTVLGYAAYTFALGGLAFWAPAFLERIRGMSKAEATVQFGAIVVVTGFVGTFAGGWAGDYFLKRSKDAYLWVSGWATLAAAPAAVVAFVSPSRPVFLSAIVVTELLLFASTGPINSAIINVVAPTERATAVALSILGIHLLGDVPSPPLIGALSDATSLGTAFLILPAVIAIAGGVWLYAASRRGRAG